MKTMVVLIGFFLFVVGCGATKVLVKKDSCKEVFVGALLELELAGWAIRAAGGGYRRGSP